MRSHSWVPGFGRESVSGDTSQPPTPSSGVFLLSGNRLRVLVCAPRHRVFAEIETTQAKGLQTRPRPAAAGCHLSRSQAAVALLSRPGKFSLRGHRSLRRSGCPPHRINSVGPSQPLPRPHSVSFKDLKTSKQTIAN